LHDFRYNKPPSYKLQQRECTSALSAILIIKGTVLQDYESTYFKPYLLHVCRFFLGLQERIHLSYSFIRLSVAQAMCYIERAVGPTRS
jgi:hypothetical protein